MSVLETLKKRQAIHDRRADGLTQSQLQIEFNVARATVRDWLARHRPTDAEIEDCRRRLQAPGLDETGNVGFKARFAPGLFAELRKEAEEQNASTNAVVANAVALYLECMKRARAGSTMPVNVLGYRA
jgi:predicted HicB family RNase H-like nuclease